MTTEQYVSRYTNLVEGDEGIKVNDVASYVGTAVRLGLQSFWGANDWTFKEYEHDLVLSSSAEEYELPDNFEGYRHGREEVSVMGTQLQYYTKEDFDRYVPKLSSQPATTPQALTIYKNADTGKWLAKFWPQPGGSETLYLTILVTTPSDCGDVPDKAQDCLDAYIAKKVFPYGSFGYKDAATTAEVERLKLEVKDKVKHSKMTVMPTGDDRGFSRNRPWTYDEYGW